MAPRYCKEQFALDPCWKPVTEMKVLGHLISDDASVRCDWSQTKESLWRAFWKNCGSSSARCLTVDARICLLQRTVLAVVAFRFSRWPPQKQIAHELDQLQATMICYVLGVRPNISEDPAAFCRRRMRLAHAKAKETGRWSDLWCRRFLEWDAHLCRHHEHPAYRIRETRDAAWLRERRTRFAHISTRHSQHWGMLAGRTMTTASAGHVAPRWEDGVAFAANRMT